ncbi:MAG: DUF370 domain-containing protein [Oscillospiraceae bacterium]|nr:DUF370 domain-containing protein [Oscillospiraceae bacterium]
MYLNIGSGLIIEEKNIIGIFDLDNTSQSHLTRAYLKLADQSGAVINAAEDIPKSFIVCEEKGRTTIYLCQAASSTLNKRCAAGQILN